MQTEKQIKRQEKTAIKNKDKYIIFRSALILKTAVYFKTLLMLKQQ
jgi:hypothetical protein